LLSARFQQGLQKSEGERQATVEAHPIAQSKASGSLDRFTREFI